MPYQKPVFYAQTAPQGSYAAGCPAKDNGSWCTSRKDPSICKAEGRKCLKCERTQ
ncbi:MAG: hypothetical protein K6C34_00535 [Alphaproteobacteria bacterium]|nr:hypothetical protein [Alphaproteobacteria bacterium]